MKKGILLSLVVLLSVSGFAMAATTPAHADYAENQIIVKFRRPVADTLEMRLSDGISASELKLSHSMDMLNKKYRLKKAKPLFKNFRENKQYMKALLKKDKGFLTKKEKHILGRFKRAPKGAKVPELDRIYKIELDLEPGQSLEDVVTAYNNDPDVEYAELNYNVSIFRMPNDPCYPIQWPLNNTGQMYPESGRYNAPPGTADCDIDAPQAWDIYTGSSEVVVADIDTGVDYTHRDLVGNMWINTGENPNDGLDDDGNGYVDDIYGYDFCYNDSNPTDDHGHGTHCAGIISAEGDNGLDIAGVFWEAKIMAIKFLSSSGSGSTSDAVEAFYYAVENGADVTSNSWGGGSYSETMEDAINYAYSQGVIMVASAGNNDSTNPKYPAYYDHMISVAATNSNDEKASFSNYGDWVDIAAPGVDILSLRANGTSRGTTYDNYTTILSGTSMACPYVSGACALILSHCPGMQVDEVEHFLLESTDPISITICASGRLNVHGAMLLMPAPQGKVFFDNDFYSCSGTIGIKLLDSDLAGNTTQQVIISTDAGDFETVFLARQSSALGIFVGTISTGPDNPNIEDGILQVSHGQVITATYEDTNDGTGNTATVTDTSIADCVAPVISNVQVQIRGTTATITFQTDEPTMGQLRCGFECGPTYPIVAEDLNLSTTPTIILWLQSDTDYYFVVEANDAAGNHTTDDNAGQCYQFTTSTPFILRVPAEYPTIQAAIDAAFDGDVILVADGTYTGDGNRDIDFEGGAITVKSENGPENCIIDCEEQGRGFNFDSGENFLSILDGVTIINGVGPRENISNWPVSVGGAIFCKLSSPTIRNCTISDNRIDSKIGSGGGIYCYDSNAIIDDCTIRRNGSFSGGGISCHGGRPTVRNCIISDNSAWYMDGVGGINCDSAIIIITSSIIRNNRGVGISCYGGRPTISNCTISGNSGQSYPSAGGIQCQNSSPTITNCTITGNAGYFRAGGINCRGSGGESSIISNCRITGNTSFGRGDEGGGGIYVADGIYFIQNCAISDNSGYYGGGIYCWEESDAVITNCTVNDNKAEFGGGIYCGMESNTTIINSVLWGNEAPDGPEIYLDGDNREVQVSYSNIQGGWEGEGNIEIELGFAFSGDYHLMPGSVCIDAGTSAPAGGLPATDIDGNPRVLDGDGDGNAVVDMGAYEFNRQKPTIAVSSDRFYFRNDWPEIASQTLSIRNSGGGTLNWEIIEDCEWLEAAPISETSVGNINELTLTVDAGDLEIGSYSCTLTVVDSNAANNPVTVQVELFLTAILQVPGQFDTIQAAVDAANDYDMVLLADGTYTGDGNRDIIVDRKCITIRSENGPENCIIDSNAMLNEYHCGFNFSNNQETNSVIDGFTIINGYTTDRSGGIDCRNSALTISNCNISGNTFRGSSSYGGGISVIDGIYLISNCTISNNSAGRGGSGGIVCNRANVTISDCKIGGNTALHSRGGCGGGISVMDGIYSIYNCTISGNSAERYGGGIFCGWESNTTITNCILWGNEAGEGQGIYLYGDNSEVQVSYSDVQGGWEGEGNIDADPCFSDPCSGDYHLPLVSPCIDAGDPNYVAETNETDLDGNPRVTGGRIDMGAYEANYIQSRLRILPQVINRHNQMKKIMAWLQLPQDITKDQIDQDQPLLLYPGPLEPVNQYIFEHGKKDDKHVSIFAFFDKAELMDAVPDNGLVDAQVIGSLNTGQEFYGFGSLTILDRQQPRKRLLRR